MGRLKLISHPDRIGAQANRHSVSPEEFTATQRVEHSTTVRRDSSPNAEQPRAARLGRPSVIASAPTMPIPPGFTLAPGFRVLFVGLILVALVPNLILGAIFWLGAMDAPWSKPYTPVPIVQTAIPPAVLTAPSMLQATTGEDVTFPIALDGTDGVPARSIIAISGLPLGSRLSDGRPYGESEWNLRSDQIGDLRLVLPDTARGESKLTIKLITPDDKVIAETETILRVASAPSDQAAESGGASAALAPTAVLDPDQSDAGSVGGEERPTIMQAAIAPIGDPVESPSDKSAQSESDEGRASWVRPSAYVNMREGPSSSAPVVGVIAKGAKLSVIDRKRGWLQVTNPATSEKGWIYSGYIAGAARPRHGTKRAAAAEPQSKSESFWDWLNP